MTSTLVQAIMNSCNLSQEDAKKELDAQIRYLRDLIDADDFRSDDIYQTCDDLGLEYDYAETIASLI